MYALACCVGRRLALLCRRVVDMQVELRPHAFLLYGFEARRGIVRDRRFVIHNVVIINTSCCVLQSEIILHYDSQNILILQLFRSRRLYNEVHIITMIVEH